MLEARRYYEYGRHEGGEQLVLTHRHPISGHGASCEFQWQPTGGLWWKIGSWDWHDIAQWNDVYKLMATLPEHITPKQLCDKLEELGIEPLGVVEKQWEVERQARDKATC